MSLAIPAPFSARSGTSSAFEHTQGQKQDQTSEWTCQWDEWSHLMLPLQPPSIQKASKLQDQQIPVSHSFYEQREQQVSQSSLLLETLPPRAAILQLTSKHCVPNREEQEETSRSRSSVPESSGSWRTDIALEGGFWSIRDEHLNGFLDSTESKSKTSTSVKWTCWC